MIKTNTAPSRRAWPCDDEGYFDAWGCLCGLLNNPADNKCGGCGRYSFEHNFMLEKGRVQPSCAGCGAKDWMDGANEPCSHPSTQGIGKIGSEEIEG